MQVDTKRLILDWNGQTPDQLLVAIGEWLEDHALYEAALEYYHAASSLDSTNALAKYRLGNLQMRQANHQGAAESLRIASNLTPDHAPTSYLASVAELAAGHPMEALAFANRALVHDPRHAGAWLQKLRSLHLLERWEELLAESAKVVAELPNLNEAYLLRGIAALNVGQRSLARRSFEATTQKTRDRHVELARRLELGLSDDTLPPS